VPDCSHTEQEKQEAAEDLCPLCLDDRLREALLKLSLVPGNTERLENLRHENALLWRVIKLALKR
jgi:hypothetical protein